MELKEAIFKRRSVRAFAQEPIGREVLEGLIEAARVGPSAGNRQPLEYVVVTEPGLCAQIYACLKWAAYLAPNGDPPEGMHPTAYVVVLINKELELAGQSAHDVGAAVQTILLAAVDQGVAACWLRSANGPRINSILGVPKGYTMDSVVALGLPGEHPVMVDLADDQEGLEVIRYWRDEAGKHHVPKRSLGRVLHWEGFKSRRT